MEKSSIIEAVGRCIDKILTSSCGTGSYDSKTFGDTLYGFLSGKKKPNRIIIKPNMSFYWKSSTGQTTDPLVVLGVIRYLRKKVGEDVKMYIAEADASSMRFNLACKILGYEEMFHNVSNVEFLNLSEGEIVEKNVKANGHEFNLKFNSLLLESDFIVNVPKLKYVRLPYIPSISLKNMYGAISTPRKYVFHEHHILHEAIVAANKIVPTHLIVVDALVALGKDPTRLGLIIGGNDAVSIDILCSKLLRFRPDSVKYLKLAQEEEVISLTNGHSQNGATGPRKEVKFVEDEISFDKITSRLESPRHFVNQTWNLQIGLLKLYAKISGDTIPPALEKF
jgi:uncharacterized protein (DUF362 family)